MTRRIVSHRGEFARHARVLRGPSRDNEVADREEGLLRSHGRGRLARRLPGQSLCARARRRGRHRGAGVTRLRAVPRPGCGVIPWSAISSNGCADTTNRLCETHRQRQSGFYGLDLYSLHRSMQEVVGFLDNVDPPAAARARSRYSCFDHVSAADDGQAYGFRGGVRRGLVL